MREFNVKISTTKKIKTDIYLLAFKHAYVANRIKPGQFLHIKIDENQTILRRPLSVHKVKAGTVYVLFEVRGRGTKLLSTYKRGKILNIIGPLGNGFNLKPWVKIRNTKHEPQTTASSANILIGGGIGAAPLFFLAQKLKNENNTVLIGAPAKDKIVCVEDFKKLGCNVQIATDNGTKGYKGPVTGLLKKLLPNTNHPSASLKGRSPRTAIYACGPKSMFAEIYKIIKPYKNIYCEVSFDQFMGCGLGFCYTCVIKTKDGYKKLCKEGPVFRIDQIW
ncbi:MAG: dihydroorotate dehydrogenase electron transfer subunit [Candidatus Omnitrophota bacterium]